MNIQASDKGTGNSQNITITNDKGRLSQDDIERMVREAEKYKDEDNLHKETIESRNTLEALIFQTKSTVENEQIKSKLDESELNTINDILSETELWLNSDSLKKKITIINVQKLMVKLIQL